jgi:hypothetical protein
MFESSGNLSVYNGSCCYGILQMNTANIQDVMGKGYSPADFVKLPLQAQVNAWAMVMSPALDTYAVRALEALGVFDGRKVDGALVLACMQLGTGNCMRMIKSHACTGFVDRLGTTICKMADKISGGSSESSAASGSSSTTGTKGTTTSGAGATAVHGNCVSDGNGGCVPMTQSMAQGFQQGSGVSGADLRAAIQALAVAITVLIMGSALLGLWKAYYTGTLTQVELLANMQKVFLAVAIMLMVMTVV